MNGWVRPIRGVARNHLERIHSEWKHGDGASDRSTAWRHSDPATTVALQMFTFSWKLSMRSSVMMSGDAAVRLVVAVADAKSHYPSRSRKTALICVCAKGQVRSNARFIERSIQCIRVSKWRIGRATPPLASGIRSTAHT